MKRKFLKFLSFTFLTLALSGCQNVNETTVDEDPPSIAEEALFTAGVFTGVGNGFGGEITIAVTFSTDEILNIEIVSDNETTAFASLVFDSVPNQVIEFQSLAIDAISGATETTNGFMEALTDAVEQAGGDVGLLLERPIVMIESPTDAIELETEILIVGSGGAGMSAAVEVIEAGRDVLVIEKMPFTGGNTRVAGSAMNVPLPEAQRELEMSQTELDRILSYLDMEPVDEYMERWQGEIRDYMEVYLANNETYLYDSNALYKLQTYIYSDFIANPTLIELFVDGARDSKDFLTSLGAGWRDVSSAVGALWVRSHMPDFVMGPVGYNFIEPQLRRYEYLGGEILLEYRAETLIMEDGRIVGARGTTGDGTPFTIWASRGVLLATGGFAYNVEMREYHNVFWPTLGPQVPTTNLPLSTGDGITMAEAVDANLIDMEWIQLVTHGEPLSAAIDNVIYINIEGERFIHEDGRRDDISMAILSQPESFFWFISDGHKVDDVLGGYDVRGRNIRERANNETFFVAETLEELADMLGINPEIFLNEITTFNAAQAGEIADPFGRQVFGYPINKAPFVASRGVASVHYTMGGIEFNERMQVISRNGDIIPGLYAAGEVTGGVHGANRLGGSAITEVITFGRLAGQVMAAEEQ